MTKQEKINYIYEKIADKTLSFGCKVSWYKRYWRLACNPSYVDDCEELVFIHEDWVIETYTKWSNTDFKIIWHQVMIWDVLDYIEKKKYKSDTEIFGFRNFWYSEKQIDILLEWKNKRTSIENQSDDCIDYIYNLIKQNANI